MLASGYGQFRLRTGHVRAHRFAYEEFVGRLPAGKLVLHSCDNPRCVNPDHLRAGTAEENVADCQSRGRFRTSPPKGESSPNARLTDEDVADARRRSAAGESFRSLASALGVARITAWNAVRGVSWAHLDDAADTHTPEPIPLLKESV